MTAADVAADLAAVADPADAVFLQRFFKTGPGQYGEGDVFLGVRVPATRKVVKLYNDLPLDQVDVLLDSEVHEHRLAALLILNVQYAKAAKKSDVDAQKKIVDLYLAALRRGRVNNWDLVDSSAENIIGPWLFDKSQDLLFELAAGESLWERRVALLSTFAFIKRGDATVTFDVAERLLSDRADLIQKALGWMLREVGKKIDRGLLETFLDTHASAMGRTALSYATEHFDPETRKALRAR
ncbi:DNA alkylation repair protein [Antrihabitans sp. YC2-6]|uniref:DNA alkylation repair protein n=1 Tax=Antrihabitans sp. YC2-6 TaxID=2799498 RepID=UPI0018F4A5FE|nr:DNA alkylation repair protein [Antrihabitans sp. YC2-6]MBJ8348002.1 DNA alkylation repair protein [Antrihabitans sp. YC2-6]